MRRFPILAVILASAMASGQSARAQLPSPAEAPGELGITLDSLADGEWLRGLLAENPASAGTNPVFERCKARIEASLLRHRQYFLDLSVREQGELLPSLQASLARHIAGKLDEPAWSPSTRRAAGMVAAWLDGRRAGIVADYTAVNVLKLEVLLQFADSLRLAPELENIEDGSLVRGWLRYVRDREGPAPAELSGSMGPLVDTELARFEDAWRALDARKQLTVYLAWDRQLMRHDFMTASAAEMARSRAEPSDGFLAWLHMRLLELSARMCDELIAGANRPEYALLAGRVRAYLDDGRISEEARRWFKARHGGLAGDKDSEEAKVLLSSEFQRQLTLERVEAMRAAIALTGAFPDPVRFGMLAWIRRRSSDWRLPS